MEIIEEAKINDVSFREKFKAAHEFLSSETLKSMMSALERRHYKNMSSEELEIQFRINEMLDKVKARPNDLDFETQTKMDELNKAKIEEILSEKTQNNINNISSDFIGFSGVNKQLDEVFKKLDHHK